jgi:hypothetical protein
VQGKKMVVQVTNTGSDLTENHFDIQIPGGGVGIFNGCSGQFGAPNDGWGARYGGISSRSQCSQLPKVLQPGCQWRFDWFKNADNPSMDMRRVKCPKEIVDKTGCRRNDDDSQPAAAGAGASGSGSKAPSKNNNSNNGSKNNGSNGKNNNNQQSNQGNSRPAGNSKPNNDADFRRRLNEWFERVKNL